MLQTTFEKPTFKYRSLATYSNYRLFIKMAGYDLFGSLLVNLDEKPSPGRRMPVAMPA